MKMRLSLIPRSLGTQLILLLLAALIASQVIALWLYAGERRAALFEVIGDAAVQRTSYLLPLLEDADDQVRAQMLRAASTAITGFYISDTPEIEESETSPAAQQLSRMLHQELGKDRDVRTEVEAARVPLRPHPVAPDGQPMGQQGVPSSLPFPGPDASPAERQRFFRQQQGFHPKGFGRFSQLRQDSDQGTEQATPDEGTDASQEGMGGMMGQGMSQGMRRVMSQDRSDADHMRRMMRPLRLAVNFSVQLKDGKWLNVLTTHRPPPPEETRTLLLQIGLMALAIIIIVAVVIRQISKPMKRLASAAEGLGRGEDVPPLAEQGPSEVRVAIRAFNDMQARLKRFVSDRTRMLAAVSHDLRTPITSLRLRAEFIDDDENRDKIIETLNEMSAMTEATLSFARDEANSEERRRIDLGGLVESIAADQCDLGRDVSAESDERIVLQCRPVAMKRALRNVIENAIRYGKTARAHVSRDGQDAVVTIEDDGPGIPPERLNDVFEPFVRLEESRNIETGGIGLGLSISRSIIHQHGGTITLENRPEGGLKVTLRLPTDKATAKS